MIQSSKPSGYMHLKNYSQNTLRSQKKRNLWVNYFIKARHCIIVVINISIVLNKNQVPCLSICNWTTWKFPFHVTAICCTGKLPVWNKIPSILLQEKLRKANIQLEKSLTFLVKSFTFLIWDVILLIGDHTLLIGGLTFLLFGSFTLPVLPNCSKLPALGSNFPVFT